MSVIYNTAVKCLQEVPEEKLNSAIDYLRFLSMHNHPSDDDVYCLSLYNDYLKDTTPDKDDAITLEELAVELDMKLS